MGIEHKAYIFESDNFNTELRSQLESSLRENSFDSIRSFIFANFSFLSDPYEGEPLDSDWENMIEEQDVHQYSDFALTKYYSPKNDKGLGSDWEPIEEIFANYAKTGFSPFLGSVVGKDDCFFDPGKIGSYFQSESDVKGSLLFIESINVNMPVELSDSFERFKSLLKQAIIEKKGIYVTF